MAVKINTVRAWCAELDPRSKWIEYNAEKNGLVSKIWCRLCKKHIAVIRMMRNYNNKFVVGVTGTSLKKDNLKKHVSSEQHKKAEMTEWPKPKMSISDYTRTPLGKSFSSGDEQQREKVGKFVDIAYVMAKEDIPYRKFPKLIELEEKHGVKFVDSYKNEIMCKEFALCISEGLEGDLKESLAKAEYFSILTDGSTDSGIQEKELIYIMFVNKNGHLEYTFFRLKNCTDATAPGLKKLIETSFADLGMLNLDKRLAGLGADGASVNMGVKKGLAALFRADGIPWLVSNHCFNHRLELAVKNAFQRTYMDDISDNLMTLYYFYGNSPKRLAHLRGIGNIIEQAVSKPLKCHGTRWVQHKLNACKALLKSFKPITMHLESMVNDAKQDGAKAKGILNKLQSAKFVLHVLSNN